MAASLLGPLLALVEAGTEGLGGGRGSGVEDDEPEWLREAGEVVCSEATMRPSPRRGRTIIMPESGVFSESFMTIYPGRKPPFLAVKRPARPYKSAIQKRFTMGNDTGA